MLTYSTDRGHNPPAGIVGQLRLHRHLRSHVALHVAGTDDPDTSTTRSTKQTHTYERTPTAPRE